MDLKTNETLRFELAVNVKYRKEEISDKYIMERVSKLIKGSGSGDTGYSMRIIGVKPLMQIYHTNKKGVKHEDTRISR